MTFKAVPSFITKTLKSRPKKMKFLNEVFSFSYCSSSVFSRLRVVSNFELSRARVCILPAPQSQSPKLETTRSLVFSVVFYTCMIDDICQISFETLGFHFLNLSINHLSRKTIECAQYSSTETQLLLPVFKAKF